MTSDKDFDTIVIGAGLGGLTCATRLSGAGQRVLIVEKKPHIGGTSSFFSREGFVFPMGPLSFSHPEVVQDILKKIGSTERLCFSRSHFQVVNPKIDIVMSKPLAELQDHLSAAFPKDKSGIAEFFTTIDDIIQLTHDRHTWHPEYNLSRVSGESLQKTRMKALEAYDSLLAKDFCKGLFSASALRNFLGNQGSKPPQMSLSYLATMWDLMSKTGIWYPEGGPQNLVQLLHRAFKQQGGETLTSVSVAEILVSHDRVERIRTSEGKQISANWVVSNADPKTVFLNMLSPACLPESYLDSIRQTPYTPSEICVYLGVSPAKIDFNRIQSPHVFYRREIREKSLSKSFDFDDREIEVCLWSRSEPKAAPPHDAAVLLRCSCAYEEFSEWRTGERKRKPGYTELKTDLAHRLISTANSILPGLSDSVIVQEIATPLTYRDWGYRYEGSLAGWTWHSQKSKNLPGKLMITTPLSNLLMVGIYAASELFLGGVSTAMYTGLQAANFILNRENS